LILYWESILHYIEGEEELSPTISINAATFLSEYPETKYTRLVQQLHSMEKVYRPNGMSLGFNIGKVQTVGNIKSYLKGNSALDFELGWTYRAWHLRFGYRALGFDYSDTLKLSRIDDLVITESSTVAHEGPALKIGYTILDKDWIRAQPFISGESVKFYNYIERPDSANIGEKGNSKALLSFGTEVGVRLMKNLIGVDESRYLYYPREEKDLTYNPVFLNFRVGYYPEVFAKPTGISGSSLYLTIGLEWLIAKKQAHYRTRK